MKKAAPCEGAAGGEECVRTNANEVQVRAIYCFVVILRMRYELVVFA